MPIELILSPILGPFARLQARLMSVHRDSSIYTPMRRDLTKDSPAVRHYAIRKEFGTGSKVYSVFSKDNGDFRKLDYSQKLFHMTRSRAVKGAYKLYSSDEDSPIGTLRAGLRSNVLLFKMKDGSEIELGWHVVTHSVDALDQYRSFQLADGQTYQWNFRSHTLERVLNSGQKEAEVRERVASVVIFENRKGFDLEINEDIVPIEMGITTALICYIEMWNTFYGYGGIYGARAYERFLPWKRD